MPVVKAVVLTTKESNPVYIAAFQDEWRFIENAEPMSPEFINLYKDIDDTQKSIINNGVYQNKLERAKLIYILSEFTATSPLEFNLNLVKNNLSPIDTIEVYDEPYF